MFQVLLCIKRISIKRQSFVYTHLNDQKVLFLIIRLIPSHLFALSFNVKQLYLTHGYDPIMCYKSGHEWTWERWQSMSICILHSFNITGTLPSDCLMSYPGHFLCVWECGVLPMCREAVGVFYSQSLGYL